MPIKAKVYLSVTLAVGFVLLAGSFLWFRDFPEGSQYLACLSLACIASTMKVRLPGLHGNISVNFVFILMAIAGLSLAETLTLSFAAAIVQCTWRPKTQPKLIQVLFSACTLVISSGAAYVTAHEISARAGMLVALASAATVFFALNTGMVSLVLALVSDTDLFSVWKRCHVWTFPYYLVGAGVAAAVSSSARTTSWRLSLLALPLMYLVYLYYWTQVSSHSSGQQAAGNGVNNTA